MCTLCDEARAAIQAEQAETEAIAALVGKAPVDELMKRLEANRRRITQNHLLVMMSVAAHKQSGGGRAS